ncbi:N-acetyltransferase GCN5 [Paraburkholderia ribeironis]|uniref:N-acetyltransferase GCN5 n=1 Tax=Paraburkholderia ribeironis TaxID=1247936 RepID=A0A1N7SHH6_9BURK|nr:GNAT family N-acetyltransferase [Paraburkholderia ribeironis]SIT46874.1 N-acetyltransferase GCN5 [Paraburkholderia ribeironis]
MSGRKEAQVSGHEIVYRPFSLLDVAGARALSSELGWPHRVEDWQFVAEAGTGFVAEDASGTLVGTGLCWKFGHDRASLGMVIVSAQQQGRGIGRKLMELLLEELGERTVILHATAEGRHLYEKLGFEAIGTVDQHQGTAFQPPLVSLPPGERLRPLGSNDTARLIELGSRASGLDRGTILPALLEVSQGIALARDGDLIGFALIRRFGHGFSIGPVVAPDSDDSSRAKALISYWLSLHAGAFVRIDTPHECQLSAWLEALGLSRVGTVVKMARNGALPTDASVRQFGIVNQAVC